jgi:gliding motility-associated-like protein
MPCPIPPTGGITPTSIDRDDRWSDLITLPFTFYFFGQAYNELIIGDNGVVSFDTNRGSPHEQRPNDQCDWSFNQTLPNANLFRNTIFGAYHDLDISHGGTIKYYVSGVTPQRKFVVLYDDVAQFDCNSLHTTQRIILYETSNVIDVQIDEKPTCTGWNNGNAVVGIQNEQGTVAYVPSGRNTGSWTVPASTPELWRFIPNHNPPNLSIDYEWYEDATNTQVGTGQSVNVCVTEDTVYRVEASFDDPISGQHYTLIDKVTVFFYDDLNAPDLGNDVTACQGTTVTLDAGTNADSYQWEKDGTIIPGATNATLDVTEAGNYTATAILGVCSESDDVNVFFQDAPDVSFSSPDYVACDGSTITLTPSISNSAGNETYQWQKDNVDIAGATNSTLDVTEAGVYTVLVTNDLGCIGTASANVIFDPYPNLDLGEDQIVCSYDTAEVKSNITDADTYYWEVNGTAVSNNTDTLTLNTPGEYDVVLTIDRGTCTVSDDVHITILNPITVIPHPILYGELDIDVTGGLPPYKYSVDGTHFQKSNHFEDLPDGDYYISIKDKNACEYDNFIMTHVINLIKFQFFTPNGDGFNDFWRIGNAENTPNAELYVYNRFGKIIRQMHTGPSEVWDGTYNGKPLPAGDYWYMLILPDGKVHKGHFALKR